jgi:hypothetical protein
MKRLALGALVLVTLLPFVPEADAARVRVKTRRTTVRVRVNVRPGFPIRRTMPTVVVRGPVVRVAPRVYLAPVVFTAAVIATAPAATTHVWTGGEQLDREDGWTDFTVDVDRRGRKLYMDIEGGEAQVSFAEVVFENGDAQVVDFNDRVQKRGTYEVLDFRDGRKVDHVRMVAKADRANVDIRLYLVQ